MGANYTNFQKQPDLIPLEVLGAFCDAWPEGVVRDYVWRVFMLASAGGLGKEGCVVLAEDVALLFDQLIDLVAAAHQLHEDNRVFVNVDGSGGVDND